MCILFTVFLFQIAQIIVQIMVKTVLLRCRHQSYDCAYYGEITTSVLVFETSTH
jgi:hypothetical protein